MYALLMIIFALILISAAVLKAKDVASKQDVVPLLPLEHPA